MNPQLHLLALKADNISKCFSSPEAALERMNTASPQFQINTSQMFSLHYYYFIKYGGQSSAVLNAIISHATRGHRAGVLLQFAERYTDAI
ncbi:MAG: hypothetical protein PHC50_02015 [Candidatus Cloacimonetes bacterium]|nr:hypothetical protein [Candidatus Cloacimonadota bacterium]